MEGDRSFGLDADQFGLLAVDSPADSLERCWGSQVDWLAARKMAGHCVRYQAGLYFQVHSREDLYLLVRCLAVAGSACWPEERSPVRAGSHSAEPLRDLGFAADSRVASLEQLVPAK